VEKFPESSTAGLAESHDSLCQSAITSYLMGTTKHTDLLNDGWR